MIFLSPFLPLLVYGCHFWRIIHQCPSQKIDIIIPQYKLVLAAFKYLFKGKTFTNPYKHFRRSKFHSSDNGLVASRKLIEVNSKPHNAINICSLCVDK